MTPCPHPVVTLCTCSDSVSTHQDQDLYQDPDLRPEQIAKAQAVIGVLWLMRKAERGITGSAYQSSAVPPTENSGGTEDKRS